MEPKAKYTLVGIFVTIFALAGLGIAAWLVGANTGKQYDEYVVITSSSVDGLHKDSDVRYKGVKVGRVVDVRIDPKNPEYIKIYIEVEKDLPIKTDTKAKITSNGLTGISYVNLIGGSKDAPLLKSVSHSKYPVIKTVPTTLQRLSVLAAKLMKGADKLVAKLSGLINDNTSRYINETLKHLLDSSEHLDRLLKGLSVSRRKLDDVFDNTSDLIRNTNSFVALLKKNSLALEGLINNANSLVSQLKESVKRTDKVIDENGKNLDRFTRNGLENVNELVNTLKLTADKLNGLIDEIQNDPSVLVRGRENGTRGSR